MSPDDIEQRFTAFWRERAAVDRGASVIVAISGGGDSCALLALLCETDVVPRARIVAAYFDHRLRGADPSRDEQRAVEALCRRYGVQLDFGAWGAPVPREAAAREARYAFLAGVAVAYGAEAVVTGHTSDDQVETVLMNAMRGAGLYGLSGMAVRSTWPFNAHVGPALVRPLLGLARHDTHAYCNARSIAYVDDASNEDRSFLRNRVRNDVLPMIDAAAPEARMAIVRLSDEARTGVAAIAVMVDVLVVGDSEGHMRISRAALRALPTELVAHAWRRAVVRLLGDAREFDRRHYAVLERVHHARTGSTWQLPRGVVATVDAEAVVLSVGALRTATIDAAVVHALPFVGEIGGWRIEVVRDTSASLTLPVGAVVRGRRPGDRIAPPGMGGHKKLQDYYVDGKIPRRERDAAPVIAMGNDVLWTPFGGAAAAVVGAPYAVQSARA